MFRFKSDRDDAVYDDGTFAYAGAYWTESRELAQGIAGMIALLGVAGLIYAAYLFFQADSKGTVVFGDALIGGFFLMMAVVLGYEYGHKVRSVQFHADGSIKTPHGVPLNPWRRRIKGNHANIASIESLPIEQKFGVVIISTGGDTILLSQGLWRHEALKASVMLTTALQRLRQSKARLPKAPRPLATSSSTESPGPLAC